MALQAPVVGVWLATVALDTVGQLAFKHVASDPLASGAARWRRMARQPWLWLGMACYAFEFLAWTARKLSAASSYCPARQSAVPRLKW